ncbi:TRAP transporter large permease [Ascidiaceihabitans sp.]|uniref:TRAP transporter large permease n=1 Tax=Ascidiaceihabitans sp. TaxID=1872644 RepID=UPI00329A5555
MTPQIIGLLAIAILVGMIFLRVPVGTALLLVGLGGYWAIDGSKTALYTLGDKPFLLAQAYSLSVVPLFLLMGVVASRTKMATELFTAANALFSNFRGGLAMGTVGACAGFGAICGSSLATASTMTRVSIPEMRKHGYSDAIAAGVVASGGTLGILIPPSIILIIYSIIAQQSVPALFAAALIPGLLLAALHLVTLSVLSRLRPDDMPPVPSMSWSERFAAIAGFWKMAVIFTLVVGGIFLGWFSPTEAAAIGALLTILMGFVTRQLNIPTLISAFKETVTTTGTLFFIILGAFMFAAFMVQTRIPATLGDWVTSQGMAPLAVILFLVVMYVILGCFLDSISMILITVPVFLPIVETLGYSPIWFGVFLVIVAEIGLITPPVGLNIFVIRAQAPDIPLMTIYRGIMPFLVTHIVGIALLIAIPSLAIWLPSLLY